VDTQLKQRLTGAVILVLMGALLVPELLTGPRSRDPKAPDTALDAGGMRSHEITIGDELNGDVTPPGPGDSAPTPPAAAVPSIAAAPPRGAPVPAPVPAPAVAPAATAASAAKPPEAQPPPRAAPSVASPPAQAASRAPAGAAYVVQVGSFSSRAAADRLAADLRRRGFDSSVSGTKAGGRQLYRVRVGPARDRNAAGALASRLKSAGYAGSVVPAG
jgi:DedD protein